VSVFRYLPGLGLILLLTACGGSAPASGSAPATGAAASPTAARSIAATITASLASPTAPAVVTAAPSPPASPTGAATGTSATPPGATPGGAPLTVTGTGGAGLTVREAPNGKRLLVVSEGSTLSALGDPPQDANGLTWIHVKLPSGTEGWVAQQYVSGGNPAPAATAKATAG